jgi:hypothetical protein
MRDQRPERIMLEPRNFGQFAKCEVHVVEHVVDAAITRFRHQLRRRGKLGRPGRDASLIEVPFDDRPKLRP